MLPKNTFQPLQLRQTYYPFESTLLSMLLEAYKEVKQLRETTNELQMAVKELQDKYD